MLAPVDGTSHPPRAVVLAYLLAITAVIGCERLAPTSERGRMLREGDLVVLIGPSQSSPQWAAIGGGARRLVEQYPPLALELMAPTDSSHTALARIVDEALSKKPKAICLYVRDPETARSAARQITKAGVHLITMGADSGISGAFGQVHVDYARGAELLGKHLTEIAGGKRSYFLLHTHGASPIDTHCYERFMQHARGRVDMTLLKECNAAEAKRPTGELIAEMFARFPNAGLMVTLDPGPWLSTPPAQLLGSNARFATLGAAPVLWQYLQSGEATALVGPLDGEIGRLAAEMALMAITESEPAGLVRIARHELVTRDTLDDFANRYAEAAGLDLKELVRQPALSEPSAPPERNASP